MEAPPVNRPPAAFPSLHGRSTEPLRRPGRGSRRNAPERLLPRLPEEPKGCGERTRLTATFRASSNGSSKKLEIADRLSVVELHRKAAGILLAIQTEQPVAPGARQHRGG